jgi:hypothetical protein
LVLTKSIIILFGREVAKPICNFTLNKREYFHLDLALKNSICEVHECCSTTVFLLCKHDEGPVHSAYNPSFSACFFSRNSIFLSQQISTAERLSQMVIRKELASLSQKGPQRHKCAIAHMSTDIANGITNS